MKQAGKDRNASTTAALPFWDCGPDGEQLFSVRAGINAQNALQEVSVMLSLAIELSQGIGLLMAGELSAGHGPDPRDLEWASSNLARMAKAVIDSVQFDGTQTLEQSPGGETHYGEHVNGAEVTA